MDTPSAPTEISSPLWTASARYLPLPFLAVTSIGGLTSLANGRAEGLVLSAIAVIMGWWCYYFMQHVVTVSVDSQGLHLASWRHRGLIPWSTVDTIHPVPWIRGQPYAITFREPTPFGPKVYFLPPLWTREQAMAPLRAHFPTD